LALVHLEIAIKLACVSVSEWLIISLLITRTPTVEAALIPVTTPSQSLCSVHRRTSTTQRLLLPGPPSPVTGQPISITGQPATPTTDTLCITITGTCDFNSSIDSVQQELMYIHDERLDK